jgi:tetratricopeptide (TPR) repeat protein
MTTTSSIFARGYAALEAEDLDEVRAAIDDALEAGIALTDPRVGYLEFMRTWLDESVEPEELDAMFATAAEVLTAALELEDATEAARICLDLSDLLAQAGELDDAEHALRTLSARGDLSPESLGAAVLLQASILLDHHEDPDEALSLLEQAPTSIREDAGYLSLRAATLIELDRGDEAIALLEAGIARKDEVELRYQLGLALRQIEREADAVEHLLEVRRRDLATYEVDVDAPVDADEIEDLRRQVEDVLDSLPEPLMARVASAPIRVERWVSEDAIRAGADPRAPIAFAGQPASGDDDEGALEALVIYRDAVVAQIDDDEEIIEVVALGFVEEFDRFFGVELIAGV